MNLSKFLTLSQKDKLEFGRHIFDHLPAEDRVFTYTGIFKDLIAHNDEQVSAFAELVKAAEEPKQYLKGYDIFRDIRRETLKYDDALKIACNPLHLKTRTHLLLGEITAKVMCNEGKRLLGKPEEFDEDAGWWFPICLSSVLYFTDREFAKSIWSRISKWHEVEEKGETPTNRRSVI